MIGEASFAQAWKMLEDRFGKQPPGSAGEYHRFLAACMGEDEFVEGARAAWASREFFPRPADFLLARRSGDWIEAQRVIEMATPHGTWKPDYDALPETTRKTIQSLGGVFAAREQLMREPGFFRKAFLAEYEAAVSGIAMDVSRQLTAPRGQLRLESGK